MQLSKREISKLKKIVELAQLLIARASVKTESSRPAPYKKRVRRSGKELVAFRRMLKAERKSGKPAAVLAKKHGVSLAYIYTL